MYIINKNITPAGIIYYSDTGEEDEDLYDCVDMDEEEGNEIYEVLMKGDEQPPAPRDGVKHTSSRVCMCKKKQ